MNEKIDILMATYNGEKYIRAQIESILAQTYSNFNLIICDDCSSDNTFTILKEYEKKDERVKLFRNNENLGVISNFEKLLGFVKSDYFMYADQDDVWLENKVELSYKHLITTNSDLVFTDLIVVDENLNVISKSFNRLKKIYRKITKFEDIRRVYLYNVVTGCTIISKSKYINKMLPLPRNKDILHDHFIPLSIYLLGGKVTYLDVPLIYYRQHSNNQVGAKRYTDSLKSFNQIRNHLIDVKISIFTTYVQKEEIFGKELTVKNKEALKYFNSLKDIKNINFKGTSTYFKIYKNEAFLYKLLYYFIFHVPCICKIGYKFKEIFSKKDN